MQRPLQGQRPAAPPPRRASRATALADVIPGPEAGDSAASGAPSGIELEGPARGLGRARARLARLEAEGHGVQPLAARLDEAEELLAAGAPDAAQDLLDEVLLLSKAMAQHGAPPGQGPSAEQVLTRLLGDPRLFALLRDAVGQELEQRLEGLLDRFDERLAAAQPAPIEPPPQPPPTRALASVLERRVLKAPILVARARAGVEQGLARLRGEPAPPEPPHALGPVATVIGPRLLASSSAAGDALAGILGGLARLQVDARRGRPPDAARPSLLILPPGCPVRADPRRVARLQGSRPPSAG